MNWWKAFGIKLIGVGILTFSIFGIFYNMSLTGLFLITFIVAGVTFIGDLFLLDKLNQVIAILGDLALFFVLYWVLGSLFITDGTPLLLAALTAAYFGTVAEAVFHIYMMDKVHKTDRTVPFLGKYQTEYAEEENIRTIIKNKKKNKK